MGYYIQGPPKGKANYLINKHQAEPILAEHAKDIMNGGKAVICVVDNGLFEAAAFTYSENELKTFMFDDGRPKTFLMMDLTKAKELSGYNK